MSSADHPVDRPWLAALMTASLALLVYSLTASRSVGWHDSAELALAAWSLGASHAPGSPLHSFLGHLATLLTDEPSAGTVYLSVAAASISAGILAMFVYRVRNNIGAAAMVALVFALSFQVWASAVITEVYSLGMMFLAATLLLAWLWCTERRLQYFSGMLFCYALSLGAYFANILLLPAFVYLIWMEAPRRARYLSAFGITTVVACLIIGGANFLLAQNMAPSGEIYPDNVRAMFLYMSGSQHEPLQLENLSFLVSRAVEHVLLISKSVLYIGVPLALAGIVYFNTRERMYGYFLLGVFAIYTGYYTLFGPGDYFLMIIPAYFVLALWIGCGAFWVSDVIASRWSGALSWALPMILAASLLATQFAGRRYMAADMGPERFAEDSFAKLPADAVAIAGWKEFAVLNYFQTIRQTRTDIRLLVPARSQRIYSHGLVDDYLRFVNEAVCESPVFILKETTELKENYRFLEKQDMYPWVQLEPRDDCAPAGMSVTDESG